MEFLRVLRRKQMQNLKNLKLWPTIPLLVVKFFCLAAILIFYSTPNCVLHWLRDFVYRDDMFSLTNTGISLGQAWLTVKGTNLWN